MDKMKKIGKDGWHPERKSLRDSNKSINKVAGLVGKSKDTNSTGTALEHQSRPLASLKDPDTFGPPPKNLAYHGSGTSPHANSPDRRGFGIALNTQEIQAMDEKQQREVQAAEEADQKAAAPPIPYRLDTTGLSTSHVPKPPVCRVARDDQPSAVATSLRIKPKPTLPPRLPPRQSPAPTRNTAAPPPPYSGVSQKPSQRSYINQDALNRLGSAGVTVPGLGIGGEPQDANPGRDEGGSSPGGVTPSRSNVQTSQLSELQSRFSKISTKPQNPDPPSQGTSFAQKQAALKTASSFRNNPSSISLSDAKATASTAHSFQERHGDQVAAGWKNASALNKKYDVGNKINGFSSNGSALPRNETATGPGGMDPPRSPVFPGKKRAPPPPPQKPYSENSSATSPPPIPFSSKPRS